ncbi:golgin subfamily A member 6-like protein 6 [Salvia divinorum]|uniref:Golgin subfamily A member 6-like protein 6 n=1 Tax=Salvia divinorum TaxID=28513 RepID=A0ABD1HXD8_SALDI
MDWSENNSCIKCNKGGDVLLCNGNGCPLAVHEGCLGCPGRLDDAGRFFCPYCGYKQAVAELRKAREYALGRKKALLIFMGGSEKDMGENKTSANNVLNQSKNVDSNNGKSKSNNDGIIDRPYMLGEGGKIGKTEEDSESSAGSEDDDPSLKMNGENGNGTVEGKQILEEECEASVEKENIQEEEREASVEKENIQEEERGASVEKENIQEEEHEASVEKENIQEEEREASVEMENIQEEEHEVSVEKENIQEEEREASVEKENIQEEECEASVEEENVEEGEGEASVEEENVEEEEREASSEEENIQEEDCGTSSASTDRDPSLKRGSKRSKPMDKEPETVSVQSTRKQHDTKKQASTTSTATKRSTRISSSAMGTGKVVKEEFASPRSMRKHEKPSEKFDTFSSGKRRKVVWMEEEEEALREGAKKYMDEAKIPWKKILEESNKFDPTRTPNDLKNKWRIVKSA